MHITRTDMLTSVCQHTNRFLIPLSLLFKIHKVTRARLKRNALVACDVKLNKNYEQIKQQQKDNKTRLSLRSGRLHDARSAESREGAPATNCQKQ